MAHQYLDQLDERLQRAILGNVGTLIAFRVPCFRAAAGTDVSPLRILTTGAARRFAVHRCGDSGLSSAMATSSTVISSRSSGWT